MKMLETLRRALNQREIRETWQYLTRTNKVNVNESERLFSIGGGIGLILYGLTNRSMSTLAYVLTGGYLMYRGLTGHCPAYEAAGLSTASRAEKLQFKKGEHSRYQHNGQKRAHTTIEADSSVDEASLESLPASDPPAWTASRG